MNLTELSLLLAGAACFGLALLGWLLYRVKRKQALLRKKSEQRLDELKHLLNRSAVRAEHLAKLIAGLREQVCTQGERVQQIEQQDPRKLPITQAARLARLGTSKQDLAKVCRPRQSLRPVAQRSRAARQAQQQPLKRKQNAKRRTGVGSVVKGKKRRPEGRPIALRAHVLKETPLFLSDNPLIDRNNNAPSIDAGGQWKTDPSQ